MASRGGHSPARPDRPPDTEILSDVRPALSEATQFIANGFSTHEGSERMLSVQQAYTNTFNINPDVKLPGNTAKLQHKLMLAAANLVVHTVDADQDEEYAQQLLGSLTEDYKKFMPGAFLVDTTTPGVVEAARYIRILRSLTEAVVPRLGATAVSADEQARLMRLLAYRPHVGGTDQAPHGDIASLQVLYTYAALDEGESTIAPHITTQLEAGNLDSPIAREVFSEYEDSPHIRSLVEFAAHLMDKTVELPEAVKKLAAPESLTRLIEPYKQLLLERRRRYLQNLDRNFEGNKRLLTDNLSDPSKKTKEEVALLADDMVEELARVGSSSIKIHPAVKASSSVAMRAIQTRKRRRMAQVAAGTPDEPPTEPEVSPVPKRQLAYKRGDAVIPEGEAGFNEPFKNYIERYRGQVGVEELMQGIKDYLASADFSKGTPDGIRLLKIPRKRRGISPSTKYQLKPSEAPGLRSFSRHGNKVRVLFELQRDTAVILAVEHKDAVPQVYRRLGIPYLKR